MHPTPSASAQDAEDPDIAQLASLAEARDRIVAAVHEVVVGQGKVVDQLLVALFGSGHALFVGAPGLAKTLLVSTVAHTLDLEFSRIQFTPDLMPADITGSEVLDEDPATGRRTFRFIPGPVFCNILLADEINRTPPKTQAALLQAMQEGRVSAGGKTHALPSPFHVFATQNPIEQEGTYPLPEAQLDRFMLEIRVDYPDPEAEKAIVARGEDPPAPAPVLSPAELVRHQALVRRLPVPPSVVEYVVHLLRATRPSDPSCPADVRRLVRWGAGPRAGRQLVTAARARAALAGVPAARIEDVRALARPALRHRIVPSFAAEAEGIDPERIVDRVLEAVDPAAAEGP
ncbi:MAG: MoxR family ATPase [Deltaproteobacteria bacterium]|nr:MAG: MoxR family ATPase [Deltaproteobacteria bacterium]